MAEKELCLPPERNQATLLQYIILTSDKLISCNKRKYLAYTMCPEKVTFEGSKYQGPVNWSIGNAGPCL